MDQTLVSVRHALVVRVSFLCAATCCAVLAVPIESSAQVVTPKTLPVLQEGQFDMLPSDRAGMGGVAIAVDDTLLDPFVNPAKTTRIESSHFVSAPSLHSISGGRGGGRSLPLGGAGSWGAWSAAGMFTFQQLDRVPSRTFSQCRLPEGCFAEGPSFTSGGSAYNQYVAGSIARRLSASTSVGFGVKLAGIEAIDGVDLLYAGSDRIDQSGTLADYRFGITKTTINGAEFEALIVHARNDIRHDVEYNSWRFDPATHQYVQTLRNERNEDKSRVWGVHSEFSRPVGSEGWRLGWLGTANRLAYPKIPNYAVQNVPRDPGTTYAFDAGMGIGRTWNGATFGADLIYEPMFANTWATAASDIVPVCFDICPIGSKSVKAGDKTVENNFHFRNVKMRIGAGQNIAVRQHASTTFSGQFGLDLYAIHYRLHQTNNVTGNDRTQIEHWLEFTPTFALGLHSRALDVRYNFSFTCGAGSCGGGSSAIPVNVPDALSGGIIAAPSSQLFMNSGVLLVHKLSIIVPIH